MKLLLITLSMFFVAGCSSLPKPIDVGNGFLRAQGITPPSVKREAEEAAANQQASWAAHQAERVATQQAAAAKEAERIQREKSLDYMVWEAYLNKPHNLELRGGAESPSGATHRMRNITVSVASQSDLAEIDSLRREVLSTLCSSPWVRHFNQDGGQFSVRYHVVPAAGKRAPNSVRFLISGDTCSYLMGPVMSAPLEPLLTRESVQDLFSMLTKD